MSVGKIISISDLNVEVLTNNAKIKNLDVLTTVCNGKEYRFEVAKVSGNRVSAIPFASVIGLKKGLDVELVEGGLQIEYSDQILGKMFDSYGGLLDHKTIENPATRNVYAKNLALSEIDYIGAILWTGIKVVDFFAPYSEVSGPNIFGTGRYGIRKDGGIKIYVENAALTEHHATFTWITDD